MKDFHVKKPGAWRWTSLSKEELEEQIEKGVIHIRVKPSAPAAEAQKVARIILENYPDARTKDSIFVNVIYGYDIGISSWFFNQGFNYSPQEWQSKIAESPKQ